MNRLSVLLESYNPDTAPVRSATTSAIAEDGSSISAGPIRLGDSISGMVLLAEVLAAKSLVFIDNTLASWAVLADVLAVRFQF